MPDVELPPPVRWWGQPFSEARAWVELARLLAGGVYQGRGVPPGDGAPVLLVPGFLAGDITLAPMHDWLRRLGYRSYRSGVTWNADCSESAVRHLDRRVVAVAARAGRPVTVIGHSRGGLLARALAVRRPSRVARVVTLGTPLANQLDASWLTLALFGGARAVANRRRPARPDCMTLGCPCPYTTDLAAPTRVPLVSVWTAGDGVVRPSSCRPADAECVEVSGSHVGLAVNPEVYRVLGEVLAAE